MSAVHAHRPANDLDLPANLDELLQLDAARLTALYRGASVPKIADITGDLRGRMLAVPALGTGLAAHAVRALAGSRFFPWLGKSFTAFGPDRGEGKNRVIRDRWQIFRFETAVGKSRAGDFDAVQLDYDNPGNPWFIRIIKDEIRELRPGLYLGQAYLQPRTDPTLALFFGLERR